MAVPSQSTVRALNTNNNSNHFYPNDNKIDQFLRKITFQPMEHSTDQFEFHRASSLPTVAFFGQGGTVTNNVTAVDTETITYQRLGQHVAIDLLDNISSRSDHDAYFSQLEQQVRGTKLSILRELSDKLINGSSTPGITGLERQITGSPSQGTDFAASNPLSLDDLYRAANSCRPTDDFVGSYSGRYFISNERALRQVMHLLDSAGRSIDFTFDEDLQTEIPMIFGVPWLISDAVSTSAGSPDTTDIFVAQLEGETAIKMLYAKDANSECDSWGCHLYDIPLQQTSSQLLKAVVGFYVVMVPEATLVRLNTVRLGNASALP